MKRLRAKVLLQLQLLQQLINNKRVRSVRSDKMQNSSTSEMYLSTAVIFLKTTKGKSQNRISLKQQRFLKNDKSESFLDF